jgi:hypothetical protein
MVGAAEWIRIGMGNNILSKSRGHRLMRKQVVRDEGRRTLDSDKRKAP